MIAQGDGEEWSWDKTRWERIQFKKTLGDAVIDGTISGDPESTKAMATRAHKNLERYLVRR